jgi:hypothetical protein
MGNQEKGDKQNFNNVTATFKRKDTDVSELSKELKDSYCKLTFSNVKSMKQKLKNYF